MKGEEVFIEDLSILPNYPDNNMDDFGSVYLWGESTDKRYIGFTMQPVGGGVFYLPIYVLDVENINKGFQEMSGISTYPFIDEMISPDYSSVIGLEHKVIYSEVSK